MKNAHFLRTALSAGLASALVFHSALSQADDTEIFFSSPDASVGVVKPNVLFILDNSGSMNYALDSDDPAPAGEPSRVMALKDAFGDILRNASGINAGVIVLNANSSTQNSRYMYPVTDIDQEVPSGNELAASTPGILQSGDDATQTTSPLGSAVIGDATLLMGQVNGTSTDLGNANSALTTNGIYFRKTYNSVDYACRMNNSGVTRPINTACYNSSNYNTFNLENGEVLFHFQGLNIPPSATITNAYISMTAANTRNSSKNPNISIDVQDSKAPGTLNDNSPIGTRTYLPQVRIPTTGGWTNGSPVKLNLKDQIAALRDVAPPADSISGVLVRLNRGGSGTYTICTSGTCMPRLVVEYTTTSTVVETRMTALRFQDVAIPSGATITSASISFVPAATAAPGSATFEVQAENSSNASVFTDGENLETRPKTTPIEWTSPDGSWVAGPTPVLTQGPDITSLVQSVVSGAGWCGNNAMAFYLKPTAGTNGNRVAYSFDGAGGLQPVLNIAYTGGESGCLNPILELRVNAEKNDGRENSDRNVYLAESALPLDTRVVAARFESVPIVQGATIQDAKVILTPANTSTASTHTINVGIQSADDSSAFTTSSRNLSNRIPSSKSACTLGSGGSWVTNQPVTCAPTGLANDLQQLFARSGWTQGNALSLLLESTADSALNIEAYEHNPSQAIKLRIKLSSGSLANQGKVTVRDDLVAKVDRMVANGYTPIVPTMYDAARYLRNEVASRPTPITSTCQPTHMVLLTDGQANDNTDTAKNGIGAWTGTCTGDSSIDGERCARTLATFMAQEDQLSSQEGDNLVTTHTIGFALDAASNSNAIKDFLADVAQNGGGSFNTAENATQLSQVFNQILQEVLATDTTFVSASAPVNTFNRQDNKDELYFSLFRPAATDRWVGNLKRYRMETSEGNAFIVDVDGVPAIDTNNGFFKTSARSWWSPSNDGANVGDGGAASQLPLATNRKLLTNVTAGSNSLTAIADSNSELTAAKLGVSTSTEREALISYIRGLSNGIERKSLGDPIHATPSLITYDCNSKDAQGVCTSDVQSAIFGTNEGFVQMFDTNTGVEQFAFMPDVLLPNTKRLAANGPTGNNGGARQYGMDNTVTVWANDANSNGAIDSGEFVYAYATMGRGGRNIYALDITNPTSPSLMWKIEGGSGDFARLAQTWSAPVRTKIKIDATDTDVLVFGGGYDPDQDEADVRTIDDEGNDIFVVNARTGALIWRASSSISGMNYSIPSGVAVIGLQADANGKAYIDPNGLAGQIFVGDMGGQVWRFHVNNGTSGNALITGGLFASVAGSDATSARRFYHEPEIALATVNNALSLTVNIGSGYRGHPLNTAIDDRFYSFRTENLTGTGGVLSEADMYDATSLVTATDDQIDDVLEANGWYIRMTRNGEKVLSRPLAIGGDLLFNTYEPQTDQNACKAAFGISRAYRVDLLTSTALDDTREVVIKGSSLPSNPQLYCKGNACWAYNDPSQLIPSPPPPPECKTEKCKCDADPQCKWMPSTPRTFWTDEKAD